jgi:flavin-dependent dehydrogenase
MTREHHDVIIVGAGVAGGAAARFLSGAGRQVLVLESTAWPRTRETCSGIFGATFALLELGIADYPGELLEMPVSKIRLIFGGKTYGAFPERWVKPFYDETLYFALRGELEAWILASSDAELLPSCHLRAQDLSYDPQRQRYTVKTSRGTFTSRYLIGAGGTACPVKRRFFPSVWPRADLVVLREMELVSGAHDGFMSNYYFFNGAVGFGWVYPKGKDGQLTNLGICEVGATRGHGINGHWMAFAEQLKSQGVLARDHDAARASGSALYLAQVDGPVRANGDTCFIVGDAAAVTHRDFWNGITPSIQSGKLAAQHITGRGSYEREKVAPYLFQVGRGSSQLKRRALDLVLRRGLPRLHRYLEARHAGQGVSMRTAPSAVET